MFKIFIFSFLTNILFYSYGHLLRFNDDSKNFNNYNTKSILGVIFLSFIALVLNFFFPLNKVVNSIIYVFGLSYLITIKKFKFHKKEFNYLFLTSLITFLLIIYSNVNRPDAGLYHLPYISILNENKLIVGLSNIHFRFGHVSILQYTSAINNNFIFRELGIVIPLASIASFFIIYFFNKVLKIIKNKEFDFSNIFSLFIIIYISYKINRYSSFGNDAVAHLTFFYLIALVLSKKNYDYFFLTLIGVFAFLNKSTLVLALLIPALIILKNFKFKDLKIVYSLSSIFLISWIIKNILISGCFLYPTEISCIKYLGWTDIKEIKYESTSAEAWSKSWPKRDLKNIEMDDYIKNFNWLKSWLKDHGVYISKIILPYFALSLILVKYISSRDSSNLKIEKNYLYSILLLVSLFGSFLFFLKFPLYRYGYSYLITFFILSCFYPFKFVKKSNLINISKIFFIICLVTIISKQILRISNNYNNKSAWPNIYSFSKKNLVKSKKIKLSENFYVYQSEDVCMYSQSPCTNYRLKNLNLSKKLGYYLINIK